MSVYFIQAIDGGPIKIGTSINPTQRLQNIQTYSPVRLQILATMPGGETVERLIHRHFRAWALHGEWFSPAPTILALIDIHAPSRPVGHPKHRKDLLGYVAVLRLSQDFRNAIRRAGISVNDVSRAIGRRGALVHRLLEGDATLFSDIDADVLKIMSEITGADLALISDPSNPFSHESAAFLRAA